MNLIQGLVSVIIPCYNNAKYLRRCVDSVLAQTYSEFEIIVIDDGSNDNPFAELIDLADSRIRLKLDMPHRGVSTARNIGIHHAIGEYIVFVDGDDWIEVDHLKRLVNGLQKADCAMIMMQLDYHDKSEIGKRVLEFAQTNPIIEQKDFNLLFENGLLSSPCNKIYQTRLIKQVNYLQFDHSITYSEDLLFNLEYFQMLNSVLLLPEVTYHYVRYGESGTTRFHYNTAYTLSRISTMVSRLFGPNLSRETLAIMMRHYVWGLVNLHHKDTPLNDCQIHAEICLILSIPEYLDAKSTLSSIGISYKFQWLLKIGNPLAIHLCFKYIHQ